MLVFGGEQSSLEFRVLGGRKAWKSIEKYRNTPRFGYDYIGCLGKTSLGSSLKEKSPEKFRWGGELLGKKHLGIAGLGKRSVSDM